MYKGVSRLVFEPIGVSRVLGSARYTDPSKAIRAWCEEIHENTLAKHLPQEEVLVEDNTKMIT